jgi:FkbM family methyltransferase
MMEFADTDVRILKRLADAGYDPATIYDIGASNGGWTRAALEVFPKARVECFEPLADHSEPYAAGWAKGMPQGSDVRLHKLALSDDVGTAKFFVLGGSGVGSTLIGRSYEGKTEIEVPINTIDDMIIQGVLAKPNMIKLDIQGGEMKTLVGGREQALSHADVILAECWYARGYGRTTPLALELQVMLAAYGFHVWEIGDEYRNPQGLLMCKDLWFVKARSPIGAAVWGYLSNWF